MADESGAFARAVASKDRVGLLEVLADDVDFRALTPGHGTRSGTPAGAYRLAVRTPDGDFTVEQQAHYRTEEGSIVHLRVLCSGFRAAGGVPDVDE